MTFPITVLLVCAAWLFIGAAVATWSANTMSEDDWQIVLDAMNRETTFHFDLRSVKMFFYTTAIPLWPFFIAHTIRTHRRPPT